MIFDEYHGLYLSDYDGNCADEQKCLLEDDIQNTYSIGSILNMPKPTEHVIQIYVCVS